MKASIVHKLNVLNHEFYQSFADQFSRSRATLQPGIPQALEMLGGFTSLLDLGCGDARVGRALIEGQFGEWDGSYVGIDFSGALLDVGEHPDPTVQFRLAKADLIQPDWIRDVGLHAGTFDAAVSFSVLHHIPSRNHRVTLLKSIRSLLKPGGTCAISVWQLLHLPRFQRKVVPWEEVGLSDSDVDDGDILVDWREGGHGMRYIHHFTRKELTALCNTSGLDVVEKYRSDGETDDLGLYVVCKLSH